MGTGLEAIASCVTLSDIGDKVVDRDENELLSMNECGDEWSDGNKLTDEAVDRHRSARPRARSPEREHAPASGEQRPHQASVRRMPRAADFARGGSLDVDPPNDVFSGSARKDKIFALRKKLDDFIEEDKRRRDRNVYILERFEKIRSTVALLKSINNNNITMENDNSVSNLMTRNNDRVLMRQDLLNYRENRVDDSYILKEISKKYILIPRIYPMNRYPIIDIKQSEDIDWRSKYNILDELKKKEREEVPERDTTEHFMQKASELCNNNNTSKSNGIISKQQDKESQNILITNENNSSKVDTRAEHTSSLLNNNNWESDSKVDEDSNIQNDFKPVHENLNILNVNKDNEYITNEQIDMSSKQPEPNYSDSNQDNSSKILKKQEISKNNYDINTKNPNEIEHTKGSHSNKEKYDDINFVDSNNETSEIPINNLKESAIDETTLGTTNQQESFHTENIGQHVENNQVHQEDTSETYANEINNVADQYNVYYEEPQSQQEQLETCNNVNDESQELVDPNHYEQNYENSHENDNHSQNYENYEAYNNYPVENQNYEYNNVDQNPEYNNSNNNFIPDSTQEIITKKFSENQQNYDTRESSVEMVQNQQIYDQQNYVDPSHAEIQQLYTDNNEMIPENNISKDVQEGINPEQTYDLQDEYNAQNQGETEQQFEVGHYSGAENESDNLHQDYNNENLNEIYHDNQGIQEAYDYSAQGQEIQQHNGLAYSGQNQSDFVHYDDGSGLNAQNEFNNLQENYVDQNIHEMYQEGNLQQHNVQDNEQYDYNSQSNEIQHNDVNDSQIAQENNYVES
ncbi:GATA zinc finger domain-containing protein 14-like [Aricia agestis]|uniref:GATA zinc finger domain-containing protein 14-like n=1 Tax=Aricia agestis TaxID=91739 RepID=UPI001C209DEB|nr:GATA zinc finger domain-containing protein 14-like [Aricia agestis]